ncbi:hypothetical protein JW824_00725 [bacterium]|nr:hypothetical protein [bacterium]RQV98944.1 MAG: hypothetical protein EH221_01055 [bacterium]
MNLRQFKYSISNFIKGVVFILVTLTVILGVLLLLNYFSETHLPFGKLVIEHPYFYVPGFVIIISMPFIIRFLLRQHVQFRHLLKKINNLDYEINKTQQGFYIIQPTPSCYLEISEGNPIALHINGLKINDIKLTKKVNYSIKYRMLGIEENSTWYDLFHEIFSIIPKDYSQTEFDNIILIFKYLGKIFDRFQSINHQVEITMDNFMIYASPFEINSYLQKMEQMIQHFKEIDLMDDPPSSTKKR